MASMKRSGSDDDSEGPSSKTPRRDDDDDGGKSGSRKSRVRKKSAKVLEMEEFEEIEKKQFTKKGDPKGKAVSTPPGAGIKKAKGKGGPGAGMVSPMAVALAGESPAASSALVLPGGAELLETTPTSPVKASTKQAIGAKVRESPAASSALVLPGGAEVLEITPTSPVKASTKQAIGAKVRDGQSQGSVIKLLLSSPAIPTAPTISTSVAAKTSPPITLTTPTFTPTPPSPVKKVVVKVKTEVKPEPGLVHQEEVAAVSAPVKAELMDPQSAHVMLSSSLAPQAPSPDPPHIKTEPGSLTTDGLGSLKLKLLMSPKESPPLECIVPTSGPIPNMFGVSGANPDETDGTPKHPAGGGGGGGGATKKKAAPRKKKAGGEKGGKQAGSKSAAEQMPNLAALVSTPKMHKGVKDVSVSDGMDTSLSDTSLDMSSIVESALDMEEEAALVIAEGGAPPSKPKKKRPSGAAAAAKKKAKAQPPTSMELSGLDSDEGLSVHAEGDIAALAAKVQRSSGGAGAKKKLSKKSLELQEALDKKKRPSRRAPTAYMLYCNSQRPKVVAESPGIDFAQISRTLGVMWQCLSKKEKMMWRRKSKKLAGKGSTLISTGKGSKKGAGGGEHSNMAAATSGASHAPPPPNRPPAATKASRPASAAVMAAAGDDTPQSPVKGFGIEPIDIAAHLKLLGESLSIIGNRLQEHKGLIAVQGSLSVLLDSMLCACGPLLALTHQVPGLDGCSEATHARTLDRVAYIMPGL